MSKKKIKIKPSVELGKEPDPKAVESIPAPDDVPRVWRGKNPHPTLPRISDDEAK